MFPTLFLLTVSMAAPQPESVLAKYPRIVPIPMPPLLYRLDDLDCFIERGPDFVRDRTSQAIKQIDAWIVESKRAGLEKDAQKWETLKQAIRGVEGK